MIQQKNYGFRFICELRNLASRQMETFTAGLQPPIRVCSAYYGSDSEGQHTNPDVLLKATKNPPQARIQRLLPLFVVLRRFIFENHTPV